ncbi:MAG: ATP-dependent Clp protease ATP-binding subunit, partial [Bdellovibrionales bacterium]|nr:ATP-dependent Clp protease ATP-binding subunit [Bdellovibrionales bacterium]
GKTLTADVVAETLKDVSPEIKFDYLTINCAEFQNKHEVSSRNLGAPPGYIGFDKGGLFDALKNNPFHVVLLDEIEKADPAFFQLLLQVLEKGEATMANGDKISFKNAIIIMTSNVGTGDLHKALNPFGLNRPDSLQKNQVKDIVDDALGRHFLPEFLNRIDQRVYFQHLTKDDTRKIAGIEVQKVVSRVEASSHTAIEVKPEVYDFLVSKGYSEQYGARNMRRTVQNYIQNKLGDVLFNETAETIANSKFVFGIEKGAIKISRVDRSLPILGEK